MGSRAATVLKGGLMASIAEEAGRASAEAAELLFVEWVADEFRRDREAPEGGEKSEAA